MWEVYRADQLTRELLNSLDLEEFYIRVVPHRRIDVPQIDDAPHVGPVWKQVVKIKLKKYRVLMNSMYGLVYICWLASFNDTLYNKSTLYGKI